MRQPKILIIDHSYLIAMEAERILSANLNCDITLSSYAQHRAKLKMGTFDIVIIDTWMPIEVMQAEFESLAFGKAKVIFTTAFYDYTNGVPGFELCPVVEKPFEDEHLLSAVTMLLSDFKQTDLTGESA